MDRDARDIGAGGHFGRWGLDPGGLPCFECEPDPRPPALVLPEGGAGRLWHQVGNATLTATAHADGTVTLYATGRGFVRLVAPRGWGLPDLDAAPLRTRWGVGYASWTAETPGARIERRVWAPEGVIPALRVDVEVTTDRPTTYREVWDLTPVPLLPGPLMSRPVPPPSTQRGRDRIAWRVMLGAAGTARAATDVLRRVASRRMVLHAQPRREHGAVLLRSSRWRGPATRPAWVDLTLPVIALVALDGSVVTPDGPGFRAALPRGVTHLGFAVAFVDDDRDLPGLVDALRAARPQTASLRLALPRAPELERETTWHAASLIGAQVRDDHFEHRYVAQGSAYSFVHGVQGAPRDYALSAVPLTFVDPEGARDLLHVMMRMTAPDGAMQYAHVGRGRCTGGGLHATPSDLPLFLLWALTEHIWATGDTELLDAWVPFRPAPDAGGSTVRERALLAYRYVRDRVRLGSHGMLRVGSGDWADPLSAMVRDRRAFHRRGESGFNTTFGAWVLPRAATLVRDTDPATADEMEDLAAGLRTAMAAAWTGRWFLRGWDGTGRPLGRDHLFLDAQVWSLIAAIGTDEQRATLVREIAARCDDPSPIGATILDRPHPVRHGLLPEGWDCNGGVWAAINALLAWGYVTHDPARGWRSLEQQSLATHARAYPNVWYGVWSGPDAYNAHFGDRPGETFVQPATPMTEFPVMNSNAHAGPLLALLRVLGIETEPEGVVVRARPALPAWRLDTALGTFTGGGSAAPGRASSLSG